MPRITLGHRLQSLIDNPNLTESERSFATSLLTHYQKRNTLTKGRRLWVDKLEAAAKESASKPSEVSPMLLEIEDVLSRTEESSWDRGFLESIRQRATAGRSLSSRQLQTFEKIKAANTPEMTSKRRVWAATYTDQYQETARVVAWYYLKTGYYLDMARAILYEEAYIPPMDTFKKMTENKYALKVIAAWKAEPKYPLGAAVMVRAGGNRARLPHGGVVISTTEPIVSAAKGAKRYKILPFGKAEAILCEERDLKVLRMPKKDS
jgi:hypothetical protein